MAVVYGEVAANLARAEAGLAEAAAAGAQCAVLPECCDVGWAHPQAAAYAEPIPGPRAAYFGDLARRYGLYVVAGLTETDGTHCYNTAVFYSPAGTLLGTHRKINLLAGVEDMVYLPGNHLQVYDTAIGRVGIDICADNAQSHLMLGRALGAMGAELILSPCAWAVRPADAAARTPYEEWLEPYGTLAREWGLTVIGVSNVGTVGAGAWAGWRCIGHSLAVTPAGVALTMPYGEDAAGVAVVDVPLGRSKGGL